MRRTALVVLLLIALLIAAGCAGRQAGPDASPTTTLATTAPPVTGPGGNVTEADLLALQASIEAMSFDEPGGLSGD
jgi:uncharacterized lipoprotein YajG